MAPTIVYQIIDVYLYTVGIFEDLETAKSEAIKLHQKHKAFYQIDKVPLNTIGNFGENFDCEWTTFNAKGTLAEVSRRI